MLVSYLRQVLTKCASEWSLTSDNRLKDLFLLQSPWPVLGIIAAYLYFVTGTGQRWMKDRQAFELNSIINFYNIAQIGLNLYMGLGVRWINKVIATWIKIFWFIKLLYDLFRMENLNMFCIPAPWGDYTKIGLRILHYSHMYYLIKIIDLLDTVRQVKISRRKFDFLVPIF